MSQPMTNFLLTSEQQTTKKAEGIGVGQGREGKKEGIAAGAKPHRYISDMCCSCFCYVSNLFLKLFIYIS